VNPDRQPCSPAQIFLTKTIKPKGANTVKREYTNLNSFPVPVDDYDLLEIPVEAGQILAMMSVDIMRGVPEEAVHDVLSLRVHPVDDGEEGHAVLHGPDDHLEVGVANLGQEDVQAGPLLEPPAVLVGPVRVDQQSGQFCQHKNKL